MSQKSPFVGIVFYSLRKTKNLGDLNLVNSIKMQNRQPNSECKKIRDLGEDDHIIVYPSSKIWLASYRKLKCKVSLILTEPKAHHQRYYKKIWLLRFKFHAIFTHYQEFENQYKNVLIVPTPPCWIPELSATDFAIKNQYMSIIASTRNRHPGHKLRHQIISQIDCENIAVIGRGYQPFEHKKDGLLPYKFSIVIENCTESDYFTEKIIDSFACKTVPIYWGCPNITDYFDPKGMLTFQTIPELQQILSKLTPDSYQNFLPALEKNHKTARELADLPKNFADKLGIKT